MYNNLKSNDKFAEGNSIVSRLFSSVLSVMLRHKRSELSTGNCTGRSMIEMLGVLAIIAVLTVGGIAGYSKAMEKFKINKALQQITMIANNIRTLFANEKNFDNLHVYDWETKEHAETMLSLGIITADMYTENSVDGNMGESYIVNPFNGGIWISSHRNFTYQGHYIPSYFRISYGMVNKAICMELATKNWNELGVHTLVISDTDEDYFSPEMKNEIHKDIDCTSNWCSINFWANYTFFPLSPSLVSDVCSACDKIRYGCGFQLYFVN